MTDLLLTEVADTHARMGIMPGWGLTVLLTEAVGLRRARELSYTGNYLDASTALPWGLVNHWMAEGTDGTELEARRRAVTDRGRAQQQ